MSVIVVNGLWLGYDIDFNRGTNFSNTKPQFIIMDNFFCVFFILELVIRVLAFEKRRDVLHDFWCVFDGALVLLMVCETWLVELIMLILDMKNVGLPGNTQALRMLRLLRLVRMGKLLRALPELVILLQAMMAGMRSVALTFCLLGAITYVFAMTLRSLTDNSDVGREYFSSVPYAMFTLLIEGVIPDNNELMSRLLVSKWYQAMLFFFFLFLAALTLMNMLIGILCDVVSCVSSEERERAQVAFMAETLEFVIKAIDDEFDGMVSKDELLGITSHPEAVDALNKVGVSVASIVDNAYFIFDFAGKQALPLVDFAAAVLNFRANDSAMLNIMLQTRMLIHSRTANLDDELHRLAWKLDHVKDGQANVAVPALISADVHPIQEELDVCTVQKSERRRGKHIQDVLFDI